MTESKRVAAKREFLEQAGWGTADLSPLAGDASNRRYERVAAGPGGAKAVLMDAAPERGEDINRFLAFTAWLLAQGFSAPEIVSADIPMGFSLIEDLGDDLYARVCSAEAGRETELYSAAVDVLVKLADAPVPKAVNAGLSVGAPVEVAPYDAATLLREAMLAVEWWLPAVTGSIVSDDMVAEFQELVNTACAPVATVPQVLVLRDYHAENLLWLPDRSGLSRVGLLDYQDALAGSPAYDLVSLLEDARRDTSAGLRDAMLTRFMDRAAVKDRDAFQRDYAILGAQRNLKIVGIFARLWLRDGKGGYLNLIPRVWAHLMRDLSHPHLAPLAAFVEQHLPAPDEATLAAVRAARA
jgi:aminoglycoside/choline kinase family phosphotransferase